IAYISVWKFVDNYENANKVSSIIAIIGLLNLPVIKYSVDWWNTLHQPSSMVKAGGPSIHADMLIPLLLMAVGYTAFYFWCLFIRVRAELAANKLRALRVRQAQA
ncbi:MAG: heme transporter HemC, partial [Rhodospirillales bacterium]|nr:heme transporter HemC [Rhodospirillales bacterium]